MMTSLSLSVFFITFGKLANYFVFLRPKKTIKNASLQRPPQLYTYPRTY